MAGVTIRLCRALEALWFQPGPTADQTLRGCFRSGLPDSTFDCTESTLAVELLPPVKYQSNLQGRVHKVHCRKILRVFKMDLSVLPNDWTRQALLED